MKTVEIFTDGACSGNPGPGGYGVVLKANGQTKELSRGYKNTTNNRMELRAVIEGLKFRWVKGHAGHVENEICDRLAVEAAAGKNLFDD